MLKVKKVKKTFGDILALEDVSFDVDKGEFVFITGASGAGKTTLIRLILGEMLPDKGDIFFDDMNIPKLSKKEIPFLRQKMGVVFQDFKVLPERTLKENIAVALAVCGVDQKEWDDRVNQILKQVGLSKRKNLFPSQLSGGELQRASLARALVVNPKILIADEPTGNLDWDTADEIMKLLKEINKAGKTVLVATHHKLIVKKHGDRVVELKDGKVVKDTGVKKKEKEISIEEKSDETKSQEEKKSDKV